MASPKAGLRDPLAPAALVDELLEDIFLRLLRPLTSPAPPSPPPPSVASSPTTRSSAATALSTRRLSSA
ncbi:hypothetical protein ACP70R_005322 [Stipagrostis hirtigluma subsp. patula]